MAIIYEDAIKKHISSKNLLPVYIIFGEDGFLKKMYVDKISQLTADKDDVFNYAKFTDGCDLQEVYDALSQFPLMADKKCVILCDYDFEHCSKTDFEKLCSLVEAGGETAVFVIWFDGINIEPKKNAKFKKIVSSVEKAGGAAVQLNHRGLPELVKILVDGARKRGAIMEQSAAKYLVETAGEDISNLQNELDKLCSFAKDKTITKEMVDYVSIKTVEASVYNLSIFIMNCRSDAALKTLDELFFMRVEPMVILYTISAYYIDLYRVYTCNKNGGTVKDTAEAFLGYKGREFVLQKASQNLSKFDLDKFDMSFSALIDADKKLKSYGSEPRVILEQLIVRLIYIIAKGEAVD